MTFVSQEFEWETLRNRSSEGGISYPLSFQSLYLILPTHRLMITFKYDRPISEMSGIRSQCRLDHLTVA